MKGELHGILPSQMEAAFDLSFDIVANIPEDRPLPFGAIILVQMPRQCCADFGDFGKHCGMWAWVERWLCIYPGRDRCQAHYRCD